MNEFNAFLITYDVTVDSPGNHTEFKNLLIRILNEIGQAESDTQNGPLPNTTLLFKCNKMMSCNYVFSYIKTKLSIDHIAIQYMKNPINTYTYNLYNIMITPAFIYHHFSKEINHQ